MIASAHKVIVETVCLHTVICSPVPPLRLRSRLALHIVLPALCSPFADLPNRLHQYPTELELFG